MMSRTLRSFLAAVSFALLAGVSAMPAGAETFNDQGFGSELVVTFPPYSLVGMAWAPDGRLFVWQKNGVISIIRNGVILPTPFLNLSAKVNTVDDRGFWGLAFHPDFANNGFVYMTYVYENGGNPNDQGPKTGRLTRVTANPANPDVALPASEIVILGSIGTPPCSAQPAGADCIGEDSGSHSLGTIRFAPDGKMFVGSGDGADAGFVDPLSMRAQDLNSWNGKILRLNDDGTAPTDNPFYDGTNSIRSRVWLYGVRNPFRFSLHPVTGDIYFGEVGWNTWEEINHGIRAKNYGWPCYEGLLPQPGYQSQFLQCSQLPASAVTMPLFTYHHDTGSAAIGGPFYTDSVYPDLYRNNFFFADYTGNFIQRMILDASGNSAGVVTFATGVQAPVTLELGPDGMLYYLSFTTGQIRRIRFNGPSAVASAVPTNGLSPLVVAFSSAGSNDPGGSALTYLWDFGDGATSTQASPVHSYTAATVTTFTAKLTVRNLAGVTSSMSLPITVGSRPPTPTIQSPANGTAVHPGDVVAFQGSATDPEQGALPASALTWTVLLHHNEHVHTFVAGTGFTGSFVAQDHGTIGTFSYEIILTATDASGLKTSTSVNLPVIAETVPPSAPTGLAATAVSSSQINLSWSAATDNVGVTGYLVDRCQGASCVNFAQVGTPNGTSFSDAGLAAGTSYSYQVRATDSSGNLSSYSNIASATTQAPDATPPSAPTALTATPVSAIRINLTWNASTDNIGVTGYRLERCAGASCVNFVEVVALSATSFSDSGLSPNTSYSYRVRATDLAGNLGGYSSVTSATTLAGASVAGLVAAYAFNEGAGTTVADASGNNNTGTINGATWSTQGRYGAALNFNGTSNVVVIPGSASLNVSSAMTLEAWIFPTAAQSGWRTIMQREVDTYFLNASNGGGALQPAGGGTISGATTVVYGTQASPVSAWTHVALAYDGATLQLFVNGVQVASQVRTGAIETNGNPLRIGGNSPYGEYFQGLIDEVRVYNRALSLAEIQADMNTPVGAAASDTTPPSTPTALSATAVSGSQVNLAWGASTDNIAVAGYRLERCQGAGCTNFAQVATPGATSFGDTGLAAATSYSYQVRAVDTSGNLSGYSSVATTTTLNPDTTPPSAPSALTATATSGTQVNLAWTAATDNVGVTGYRVERCQGAGCTNFAQVATSIGASFSDTGLAPGTNYSYQVRATDAAGNLGGYSNIASATTLAPDTTPPSAPSALTATAISATQVNLAWTASTDNVGVTGYRVERCVGSGCSTFAQVATPVATSFSDSGLNPNTSYSYRVRATDAAGNLSGYSSAASATTQAGASVAGLMAAYAFNEGAGTTVADASGNNNTGTINGATWSTQGRYGAALNFNGTSNLVLIPFSASLNVSSAMTLEAWIFPTAAQNGWRTIMQREVDTYFLNASNDSGALVPAGGGTFGVTTSYVTGTSASPVSAWTHVALTYDGSAIRLYVNGVQVASQARTGAIQTNANPLRIGGNSPYGEYFLGLIDEVRVYNRALTVAEIQADMNTPVGPAVPDTTPPSAPTALTATAISGTQVNLAWAASTDNVGVTGYQVERCQGAGCSNFAQVGTPGGTTFGDTGLAPGTSYSYQVRAVDAAGNLSGYSSVASVTTPAPDTTPPSAPTALTATAASSAQINLAWGASTDNVGVTGYRVERCQGAGCANFAQVATPSGASFNDTGLAAGTSYSYQVRAVDAAGNLGGYSNVASAATPPAADTTAPSVPTGITATVVSSTQINLAWTASTDNVGVTGYQVDRCLGASCTTFAQVGTPAGVTFNNTGLAASTTYRFRVRATDAAGNVSADSSIVNATTQAAADTTAPSAPTGLTATVVSSTQINLAWTASTDNVGVTGYQVDRCLGASCTTFAQVGTPAGVTFNNTGLVASTTYRYRVRATDAAGNVSANSSIATATTAVAPDTTPPSAPSALTATAASMVQINLAWTASTDNVGVTGYRVERCQGSGCSTFAQVATPSGTSFSDTGLASGTSYSYQVRAVDAAGNLGAYSNVASTTTLAPDTTPPSAPATLTATATVAGQINLAWSASTDDVGVTGYRVERCLGAGCSTFAEIATPTATSLGDTGLSPNTAYSYRVRATDAAGNLGGYSSVASATTLAGTSTVGLVAAYAFNEGVGTTVADVSGNNNTGTINGATWTTQGRYGAALTFNGTSSLVLIPFSASLNVSSAMTLEAWVFPTAAQSGWRTIMQREVDTYFLNASNDTGDLRPSGGATFGSTTAWLTGTTANPVNAWTHVALTYDGSSLRLYVNGVQAASQARTGAIETNANPLRIGGNSPYGEYFLGRIDEVRVYNRALSVAEIQADMNSPVAP